MAAQTFNFQINRICAKAMRDEIAENLEALRNWNNITSELLSPVDKDQIDKLVDEGYFREAILRTFEILHSGKRADFGEFMQILKKNNLDTLKRNLESNVDRFRYLARQEKELPLGARPPTEDWSLVRNFPLGKSAFVLARVLAEDNVLLKSWGNLKDDFTDDPVAGLKIDARLNDVELLSAVQLTLEKWISKETPMFHHLLDVLNRRDKRLAICNLVKRKALIDIMKAEGIQFEPAEIMEVCVEFRGRRLVLVLTK